MDKQQLYVGLSSRLIHQFAVVITTLVVLILFNFETIHAFYFKNRQIEIGLLINAGIVLLFVVGLGNILFHLLRYQREEAVIARFIDNAEALKTNLVDGLPSNSVIADRVAVMRKIESAAGELDHSALAGVLQADEATRLGAIRFINNTLILTGVFGTVVSLSIALLGVSDLIDSASRSIAGIGLVIYGMSTALSTTITAIVGYVVFSYFCIRLVDVQTRLLCSVEYLTSVYLLPLYVHSADDVSQKIEHQLASLDSALLTLVMTQEIFEDSATSLQRAITGKHQQIAGLENELKTARNLLIEGFRLTVDEDEAPPLADSDVDSPAATS